MSNRPASTQQIMDSKEDHEHNNNSGGGIDDYDKKFLDYLYGDIIPPPPPLVCVSVTDDVAPPQDFGLVPSSAWHRNQSGLKVNESLKGVHKRVKKAIVQSISGAMQAEHRPEGEIRMASRGLISQKTMANLKCKFAEENNANVHVGETDPSRIDQYESTHNESTRPLSSREFRMARLGCLSRRTMIELDPGLFKKLSRVALSHGSFSCSDETLNMQSDTVNDDSEEKIVALTSVIKKKTEEDEPNGKITFSKKVLFEQQSKDILTEGQHYLGISMLVYMYSHLRETCLMGHTHVRMEDIDVNSHQSQYFNEINKNYLSFTKTAGSIVRVVVDELDCADDDDKEYDLILKENKEYEKR